jgi:hypothetical protein
MVTLGRLHLLQPSLLSSLSQQPAHTSDTETN